MPIMKCFICLSCKHYTGHRQGDIDLDIETCKAFPDEIPQDILLLRFDHRIPHPEDNGIQYELNPEKSHLLFRVEAEFRMIENRKRKKEEFERKHQALIEARRRQGITANDWFWSKMAEEAQGDEDAGEEE